MEMFTVALCVIIIIMAIVSGFIIFSYNFKLWIEISDLELKIIELEHFENDIIKVNGEF